jgi:hypothetical protein
VKSPLTLRRVIAAPIAALALGAAFLCFKTILVDALPLEEAVVRVQHKPIPTVLQVELRRCRIQHPVNDVHRLRCIEKAL